MEAGARVLYRIPPAVVARARRRFWVLLAGGLAAGLFVLLLPVATSPGAAPLDLAYVYLLLAPAWGIPLLLALFAHRLLRLHNGFEITEGGCYPPFRLRATPRGQRSFLAVDALERVTVEEQDGDFTAALALWDGRGVIVTSADLLRYYREPIRAEFPRIVEALGAMRGIVAAQGGAGKGRPSPTRP